MIADTRKIPTQPVKKPIICKAYKEPAAQWVYNTQTGAACRETGRRPASYCYDLN